MTRESKLLLCIPRQLNFWILAFSLLMSGCVTPAIAADPPPPPPTPPTRCAIEWAWQEAGLTLTNVNPYWKDGLAVGDRVLAINGQPAISAIADAEARFSDIQDPALRRVMALEYLLMANQTLRLQVQHLGQVPYFFHLEPDCQVG
jgi:hypothetical protein